MTPPRQPPEEGDKDIKDVINTAIICLTILFVLGGGIGRAEDEDEFNC